MKFINYILSSFQSLYKPLITNKFIKLIGLLFALFLGSYGCATKALWDPIGTTPDYTLDGEIKNIYFEHKSEERRTSDDNTDLTIEYQLSQNQKNHSFSVIPQKGIFEGFSLKGRFVFSNCCINTTCKNKCNLQDFVTAHFDSITTSISSKLTYSPWFGPYQLDMSIFFKIPRP